MPTAIVDQNAAIKEVRRNHLTFCNSTDYRHRAHSHHAYNRLQEILAACKQNKATTDGTDGTDKTDLATDEHG
jgi:hypothetical protein